MLFLGQMKVYKLNKDGKEHIIRIIGAGDYGGEKLFVRSTKIQPFTGWL